MMSNSVPEREKDTLTGCVSFYTQWIDICVCIRVRGLHLVCFELFISNLFCVCVFGVTSLVEPWRSSPRRPRTHLHATQRTRVARRCLDRASFRSLVARFFHTHRAGPTHAEADPSTWRKTRHSSILQPSVTFLVQNVLISSVVLPWVISSFPFEQTME